MYAAGSVWGRYICLLKTEQEALLFQDWDLPDSLVRIMFAFKILHSVCVTDAHEIKLGKWQIQK